MYDERDVMDLDRRGNFYCNHVEAMTAEGLHDKSSIAAELAYRDHRIQVLRTVSEEYHLALLQALDSARFSEQHELTFPKRMEAKLRADQIQRKLDWLADYAGITTDKD